jgi:hypothetical protein
VVEGRPLLWIFGYFKDGQQAGHLQQIANNVATKFDASNIHFRIVLPAEQALLLVPILALAVSFFLNPTVVKLQWKMWLFCQYRTGLVQ